MHAKLSRTEAGQSEAAAEVPIFRFPTSRSPLTRTGSRLLPLLMRPLAHQRLQAALSRVPSMYCRYCACVSTCSLSSSPERTQCIGAFLRCMVCLPTWIYRDIQYRLCTAQSHTLLLLSCTLCPLLCPTAVHTHTLPASRGVNQQRWGPKIGQRNRSRNDHFTGSREAWPPRSRSRVVGGFTNFSIPCAHMRRAARRVEANCVREAE